MIRQDVNRLFCTRSLAFFSAALIAAGCGGGPTTAGVAAQPDAGINIDNDNGNIPSPGLPDTNVKPPKEEWQPPDCEANPGAAGCPCLESGECADNGYCVPSSNSYNVCTGAPCIEECANPAWQCVFVTFTGDPTYLCIERGINACRPCTASNECDDATGLQGDKCVFFGEEKGSFCGIACTSDAQCLEGSSCQSVEEVADGKPTGQFSNQCVPTSGECACNERAVSDGAFSRCNKGACGGARLCTAGGLTQCDAITATDEICDGDDNNCNGNIDEGFLNTDGDPDADCVDTDDDDDTILDVDDNCPLVPNTEQSDLDGDGMGDFCDPPEMPELTSTVPEGPANENSIIVVGNGEPQTLVRIFDNEFCSGDSLAENFITETGAFAVPVNVQDDTITTFWAAGVDAANTLSDCSLTSVTYEEDSTPPTIPVIALTEPPTPSSETAPTLLGSTDTAGAEITIYKTADCTGDPHAETVADDEGLFSVDVTAEPNAATMYYTRGKDVAGNTSNCSTGFEYVHDDVAPDAPVLKQTVPPSPDNKSTTPLLVGVGEPNATIRLYTDADCTVGPVGEDTAAELGTFGILTIVAPNSINQFWANATDPAGNTSACSADKLLYVHDTETPPAPLIEGSTPPSPGNSLTPMVYGLAEGLNEIKFFPDENCATFTLGEGAADVDGAFSITINIPQPNAETAVYAKSKDLVGYESPCSVVPYIYLHDSVPPGPPVIDKTQPGSPSPEENVLIIGNAEAGSTVYVYTTDDCTGASVPALASPVDGLFASPWLTEPDTDNTFHAKAVDAAGNESECSDGVQYINDSTPPDAPNLTSTDPQDTGATLNPIVYGSAEPNTDITFFKDAACAGEPIGATVVAEDGTITSTVAILENVTTLIYAQAVDAAANASKCSAGLPYTHDDLLPDVPEFTGSVPASPNKISTAPKIQGAKETDTMVTLYKGTGCGDQQVTFGLITALDSWEFDVSVAPNTTTTYWAEAQDAAGNKSGCTPTPLVYVHDDTAPEPPTLSTTKPVSPSNSSLSPEIGGTTEPSATIQFYSAADCNAGSAVGVAAFADDAGDFAGAVQVQANKVNYIFATSTDLSGNTSLCSAPIQFEHDDKPPESISITGSDPAPPAKEIQPLILGNTEENAKVVVVQGADCQGKNFNGQASPVGSFAVAATVLADTDTIVTAFAVDAAGNKSDCSNPYVYTNDSTPPAVPQLLTTNPESPSSSALDVVVNGNGEAGAVIRMFTNASCKGVPFAEKNAAIDGTVAFNLSVLPNTITDLTANSIDDVGNVSGCSNTLTFVHDNIAPDAPALVSTSPGSPGKFKNPLVSGTAEPKSVVTLFVAGCDQEPQGVVVVGDDGSWSLEPAFEVTPNDLSVFYATATDAAGNKSDCSSGLDYVHDDIKPAIPTVDYTEPESPAPQAKPTVCGTADANTIVNFFTDAACASPIKGEGKASGLGNYCVKLTQSVKKNKSTKIYATSTDAASNTSLCSATFVEYVHDNQAPSAPVLSSFDVVTPNNKVTDPLVWGQAEADIVRIQWYVGGAPCETLIFNDDDTTIFDDGAFNRVHNVQVNAGTTFWVKAEDAAGNISECSNGLTFISDTESPEFPAQYDGPTPNLTGNTDKPSVLLEWLAATDNFTGQPVLKYEICVTDQCDGGCDPWEADALIEDGTLNTNFDLEPDTRYYFLVRPIDEAGNLDDNTQVSTMKTPGHSQAIDLSVGDGQSCAFLSTGALQCWGDDPITGQNNVTSAAIGPNHECVARISGAVHCRGQNTFGQLGTGNTVPAGDFIPVPGMTEVTQVVAGLDYTCALKQDGTVFCWGANFNKQVAPSFSPVVVSPSQVVLDKDDTPLTGVVKIWAGGAHNCALKGDATAWCWGFNYAGQASSQAKNEIQYPAEVDATESGGFVDMALGQAFTCAAGVDGRVFCFGDNGDGQLGLGPQGPKEATTPTDIGLDNVLSVGAGSKHSCAVTADGAAWCWGNNDTGQLGLNLTDTDTVLIPQQVLEGDPAGPSFLKRVVAIDASTDHTCAFLSDGQLRCWGANSAGELGDGTKTGAVTAQKVTEIQGISHLKGIARQAKHSCAVLSDGTARCWGVNDQGQSGAEPSPTTAVIVVAGLGEGKVVDVQPGGKHTCALTVEGNVLCWGDDELGQLGAGTGDSVTPVSVSLPASAKAIALGDQHSCALLVDGTVHCWGDNGKGQLGTGNNDQASTPAVVKGIDGQVGTLRAIAITAGYRHTCAIVAGLGKNSVHCWGEARKALLGAWVRGYQNAPVPVVLLSNTPRGVSAGQWHTCATVDDGTSVCWGDNAEDQSVGAADLFGVAQISAGTLHSCAVSFGMQASCWGSSPNGELGNGTTDTAQSPVDVIEIPQTRMLSADDGSTCAVSHDGLAWCWGDNVDDSLNTGGPDIASTPSEVKCLP